MLPLLFAACSAPQTTLYTFADLPGEPNGAAIGPEGNLLVTHRDATNCCRMSAFIPSAATVLHDRGIGPGRPMVSDTRAYFLTATGVVAMRGNGELWLASTEDTVAPSGASAITPDGVVVFVTSTAGLTQVYGYTALGSEAFRTPITGDVTGEMRVGLDGVIYVNGGGTTLYAIDGGSGAVLWSVPGDDQPLAVLDDGVLVNRGGLLAKLDLDGGLFWESDASVGPAGVALTHDGYAWAVGDSSISKVQTSDGFRLQELQRTCGPMTYGLDNRMWTVCDGPTEGQVELTVVGGIAQSASQPFGGPVDVAPVLDSGSAFVVVGGENPRLLGFSGASPNSSTSPWSTTHGVGNTGRPDL